MRMRTATTTLALALLATAACSGKRVHEEPIMDQGDRVEVPDGTAERAADDGSTAATRDEITARALDTCEGEGCEAIVRQELALGLNRDGVLAATRTTGTAWSVREAGSSTVMTPASLTQPPSDASGDLVMVQLEDGRVTRYAYRESQGVRLVSSPQDATTEGRALARAEQLLRQGDDYAAQGDLDRALDAYDRADVLAPNDPMIAYRIATVLDKQLRPIQALIQYKLFLHRLELERIEARGEAAAKLADAIAQARQRIIILERESR